MAFYPINGGIGVQPIATKSTTQLHPLGQEIQAVDPTLGVGTFKYLKGVASTAVGDWVTYNAGTGITTRLAANANGPVAVAMSTNTTTGSYGWYQIEGIATALGLTSITHSSGFLWIAGTAVVDDASVIGDAVINAKKTTTVHVVGTFLDTYHLSRPFVQNRVALSN